MLVRCDQIGSAIAEWAEGNPTGPLCDALESSQLDLTAVALTAAFTNAPKKEKDTLYSLLNREGQLPLLLLVDVKSEHPPYTISGTGITSIDWGDGTSGASPHSYASPGKYVIAVYGGTGNTLTAGHPSLVSVAHFGSYGATGYIFGNSDVNRQSPNLVSVPSVLPSSVRYTSFMFLGATRFNGNIGDWDMSRVLYTDNMFDAAQSFNADISRWDVSSVLGMYWMFDNAISFNADISNWDTSSCTDMTGMFFWASKFNQNIGRWDVSNVLYMHNMLNHAVNFNQDLSHWCVPLITSEPNSFGQTAGLSPVWGTCPEFTLPFNGRRPYGPNAPWNIPVEGLPEHPNAAHYIDLLWEGYSKNPLEYVPEFNNRNYTYPVYNAEEATDEYTVLLDNPGWGNLHNQKIPVNPAWQPAAGTDAQMIILDPGTGREWNLYKVHGIDHAAKTLSASNGSLCPGNYWENNWDDPATQTTGSRGAGINYLAMLVRPWEIERGLIEHALSQPISNPSGLEFFAPATKQEYSDGTPGVPEGARFSLDITNEQIETHLLGMQLTGAGRDLLRPFLVALRDYGWFITDTSGGATWQMEALASAESAYTAIEIEPPHYVPHDGDWFAVPRFLLAGFLEKSMIKMYVPSDQYPTP